MAIFNTQQSAVDCVWKFFPLYFTKSDKFRNMNASVFIFCEFLRIRNIHSSNSLNFNECINYKNISHTSLITGTNMSFHKEICSFINNTMLKLLFSLGFVKEAYSLTKNISKHKSTFILLNFSEN